MKRNRIGLVGRIGIVVCGILAAIILGRVVAQAKAPSPPAAPSNLTATAVACDQIDLSWTDNSNNETSFGVERAPSCTGTFVEIANVPGNGSPTGGTINYSDLSVSPETFYCYRVRAKSTTAGNSGYSNTADATTPPCAGTQ